VQNKAQSDLACRVLDHLDNLTTDVAPEITNVSGEGYLSEEVYRRELDLIFRKQPFIVAHETQFQNSGDYLATSLLGVPILLVRTETKISGFVNRCRHRGARLVEPGSGRKDQLFVCPSHGWCYNLNGDLSRIPDYRRGFPELDLTQRGLVALQTEVRHGLVWVSFNSAESSVADYLGALDEEFANHRLDELRFYEGSSLEGSFNWKLGIEAFLETNHFRMLHPAMKKYVFTPDISLVDEIGNHVRLVAPKHSVTANRKLAVSERRIREHATIAYTLFPSTVLFVEKKHVTVMLMQPNAIDSCDVRFFSMVQKSGPELNSYWDDNIGKFMDAVAEDFDALRAAQDGFGRPGSLRIPGGDSVVFGRNEPGLRIFRERVKAALKCSN